MGYIGEFLEFVRKHQVAGLAVAFIMGSAASKLVSAIVNDLVMPLAGALIPGGDWRAAVLQVGGVKFLIGDFAGALIDFVIIAAVAFAIVKVAVKEDAKK